MALAGIVYAPRRNKSGMNRRDGELIVAVSPELLHLIYIPISSVYLSVVINHYVVWSGADATMMSIE